MARKAFTVLDGLGRVTTKADSEAGITDTVFAADRNIVAEIDATGIRATSVYNVMARLVEQSCSAARGANQHNFSIVAITTSRAEQRFHHPHA